MSAVMTEHVDSIVIGAGVIGLAVAWQLARRGREVIVTCPHFMYQSLC
jgi:glycine/D-amino acid oxidase-like deaminating enzyme